jgi:hypothetical protein
MMTDSSNVARESRDATKKARPTRVKDLVENAVLSDACKLTTAQRLFLLVLAHLADFRSGYCRVGAQRRIARKMGVTVARVKQLRREIAELPDCPVAVEWQARSRDDGARDCDSYQLSIRDADPGSENSRGVGSEKSTYPREEYATQGLTIGDQRSSDQGPKVESSPPLFLSHPVSSGCDHEQEASPPHAPSGAAVGERPVTEPPAPLPLVLPDDWQPPAGADHTKVDRFRALFAPPGPTAITRDERYPHRVTELRLDGRDVNWDRTWAMWAKAPQLPAPRSVLAGGAVYEIRPR